LEGDEAALSVEVEEEETAVGGRISVEGECSIEPLVVWPGEDDAGEEDEEGDRFLLARVGLFSSAEEKAAAAAL
jgi:hypothetical protein